MRLDACLRKGTRASAVAAIRLTRQGLPLVLARTGGHQQHSDPGTVQAV